MSSAPHVGLGPRRLRIGRTTTASAGGAALASTGNGSPMRRCGMSFGVDELRAHIASQPAFGNHFGNGQGGFVVAMLDVPLSLAVFVKTKRFLPTIEIKTSFISPARIGVCIGEGVVVRAGASLVFAEARLWSSDGALAVHATATSLAATGVPDR